MNDRMRELRFFTIAQWQQEQNYLRERHLQGWKFVSLNFLGVYTFERCEPEDVIYQLDYNQNGASHRTEYLQMFRDCGWEYLQDCFGYSYFRKPVREMDGPEEIFCDDESRLDMMKRVFKGRIITLIVLFLTIVMPNFLRAILDSEGMPGWLNILYILLFLLYLGNFLGFGYYFWRYWMKVHK